MKKKIVYLILILISPFLLLFGCGNERSENYNIQDNNRFILVQEYRVEGYSKYIILVDKETNVMYLCWSFNSYQGGISVMLNADGTPMIWEFE